MLYSAKKFRLLKSLLLAEDPKGVSMYISYTVRAVLARNPAF
jgi:hypothetical protein